MKWLLLTDFADAFLDERSDGRLQGNGSRKVALGFGSSSLLQLDDAAIHVSLRMVGIDFDRLAEVGDSPWNISRCQLCDPSVVVGHYVMRIALKRPVKVRQGAIEITLT